MAMRRRASLYSADEVSRLLWEEDDDSEKESGTSEEEEAELEHQLEFLAKNRGKRSLNSDPKLTLCYVSRESACSIFLGYLRVNVRKNQTTFEIGGKP